MDTRLDLEASMIALERDLDDYRCENQQLRDDLETLAAELAECARERDLCADIALALAAIDPRDDDWQCVYCLEHVDTIEDLDQHRADCPWRRARTEILPERVSHGAPILNENPIQAQPVDLSMPLGVQPRDGGPAARADEEGTARQRGASRHVEGTPVDDLDAASETGAPAPCPDCGRTGADDRCGDDWGAA